MKNPIAVGNVHYGHNVLLPKPGQKLCEIALPGIISRIITHLCQSQFYLEGMTAPCRTQPTRQPAQ